jgi:argininosuccinate synthase
MTSTDTPTMSNQDIVLAFSGGLDTSFCVPYLKERGWNVHTARMNSGSPRTSPSTAALRCGTVS